MVLIETNGSTVVDFYSDMIFRKRLGGKLNENLKYMNIGMSLRAFYLFSNG